MFNVDDDAPPFTLHEPDNTQAASGHVPGEDRKPDVHRLERSEGADHEANAERHRARDLVGG